MVRQKPHWETAGYAEVPYWRRINEAFTLFLRQWNLSVNAYAVLVNVYESGEGIEPARLADLLGVKRQLVAIILNDFDRRGFIVRHSNNRDRRRRTVRFTRDGAAFADRVCHAVTDLQRRAEAALLPEEMERFRSYSARYEAAIRGIVDALPQAAEPTRARGASKSRSETRATAPLRAVAAEA